MAVVAGNGARVTNVRRQNRRAAAPRAGFDPNPAHQTIAEKTAARYDAAGMVGRAKRAYQDTTRKVRVTRDRVENELYQDFKTTPAGRVTRNATAASMRYSRRAGRTIGRKLGAEKLGAKAGSMVAAKAKVSVANGLILGWVAFFYFAVQLPFAVISTAGLGIAAYIYSLISEARNADGIAGFAFRTVEGLLQKFTTNFTELARFVFNDVFKIDSDPITLFFIPFVLIFALGITQLFLCWFIYSCLGVRSLSGKSGGVKSGLFILAGVGTVIPVLNLFPLIFFWTALVWLRPK